MAKSSIDVLLDSFGKRTEINGEMDVKNIFAGFTMEVIGKCAFATSTNTLENPDHPFLINGKKFFNVNLLKAQAALVLPTSINTMLGITDLFDHDAHEYFIDLCQKIIRDRQNNKVNNKFNDFLQLLIDAKNTGENYREEDDKLDAHHVNEGILTLLAI